MALNCLRDFFKRCSCVSKSPSRKALSPSSSSESYQRRPRQYDEISDEQLEANNAARANADPKANPNNYKRRPRDYDEIDMEDIAENCQSKKEEGEEQGAGVRISAPPPGSAGLNYVEVEIASPPSGAGERRPSRSDPPTEYTTIALSNQHGAAEPKISIEG